MTSRHRRGLLVAGLVALLVVALVAALPFVLAPEPVEPADHPEFAADAVVSDPLPADGAIEPDADDGDGDAVIVIDNSQSNRFETAEIQPLVEAFDSVGYDVVINDRGGDLNEELSDAHGLVVIDPASAYDRDQIDTIEAFVDEGGRLVILGEPDRIGVEADLFGATLTTRESELTELAARFDLYFETQFVYDQTETDGTYRQIQVAPYDDAELPGTAGETFAEVEAVSLDTATEVRSTGDAEAVLVTSSEAQTYLQDEQRTHTVALRDGDVLAIGDSSIIRPDRRTVGDNDVLLTAIVEFLVESDRDTGEPPADDDPEEDEPPADDDPEEDEPEEGNDEEEENDEEEDDEEEDDGDEEDDDVGLD